jgi:hypothetical protein
MRSFVVGSLTVLLGLGACAHAAGNQLQSRAAFDLQCDQRYLYVVALDAQTRGVRGCNRQATYVESCHGEGVFEECTWVLNGAITPVAP